MNTRVISRTLILLLLHFMFTGCERPPFYTVPANFDAQSAYRGVASQSTQVGDLRARIDYTWQLFVGHDAIAVQLHFDTIDMAESDSRLKILDANGTVLREFNQTAEGPHWTDPFPTTMLQWRLTVDQREEARNEIFRIDSIRVIRGVTEWFENHPWDGMDVNGNSPNVQKLQTGITPNKEVFAVIPPGGENYHKGFGFPGPHNFSVLGPPTGVKTAFENNDVVYARNNKTVCACRFGTETGTADDNDDIAVFTEDGEVFVALSSGGAGFPSFALSARNFAPDAEQYTCGTINDDNLSDLVAFTSEGLVYSINDGASPIPGFPLQTVVPLSTASGRIAAQFLGDVDDDGFSDVIRVIDIASETSDNTETTTDHLKVFRNNQSGGFTPLVTWLRRGIANNELFKRREFFVGKFDRDDKVDILVVTRPVNSTERRVTFQVARNKIAPGVLSANAFQFEMWLDFSLPAPSGNMVKLIDEVMVGNFGGDFRTDILMRRVTSREGSGYGVLTAGIVSYDDLIGNLAENGFVGPDFGNAIVWTPPTMPTGHLITGHFRDPTLADLVEIKGNALHELHRLNNLNITAGGGTPVSKFASSTPQLKEIPVYAWGDVNHDGIEDLVEFTANAAGDVEVLLMDRHLLKRAPAPWKTGFARNFRSRHEIPLLGDINGDGYQDLVLFADETPAFIHDGAFFSIGVFVFPNTTSSSFGNFQRWNSLLALTTSTRTPVIGDFNRDGRDDAAVIASNGSNKTVFVAYNRGTGFGPGTGGITDDLFTFPGYVNIARAEASDVNADGYDDIVIFAPLSDPTRTVGNITSIRFGGGPPTQAGLMSFNFPGNTAKGARFTAAQLAGERPGAALYLEPNQSSGSEALMTWLPDEAGEWIETSPGYKNLGSDIYTQLDGVDVGPGDRESLMLLRPNAGNAFKVINVSVQSTDLDLYVKKYVSNPTEAPTSSWTKTSTFPLTSEELTDNVVVSGGHFVARVINKGEDPAVYRLLSDRQVFSETVDLMLMHENPVPSNFYRSAHEMADEGSPALLDAMDGMQAFGKIQFWVPGDGHLDDWRDAIEDCDDEIDGYIFNSSGRASARFGCFMKLFTDDTGDILVHEYEHYAGYIEDEYCEGPDECDDDDVGGDETVSLCACKMAQSGLPELCTLLNHQSQNGRNAQESPCWGAFLSGSFSGLQPRGTPNMYDYSSVIFGRLSQVCDGECP